MRKVKNILVLIGLGFTTLQAQIATRMDQYYLDPSIINSAAINAQDYTHVGMFFNKLYAGVDGSPSNFFINVASHTLGKNYGFGGNFAVESVGFINNYNGYLSYAYTIPLRGQHKFTLSPQLGFLAQRLNASEINVVDLDDPQYQALITGKKDTRLDIKLSALYQFKGLMLGFSSGRITSPTFEYQNNSDIANYAQKSLSNAFASMKLQLNPKFSLQPVLSATMFDFKEPLMQYGLNATIQDKMWAGVHYAGNKNLAINVGAIAKESLKLGYSFSLPVSSESRLLGTGHEIYVSYIFGGKSYNPIDLNDKFVFNKPIDEDIDTYTDPEIAVIDKPVRDKPIRDNPIVDEVKINKSSSDTFIAVVPKPKDIINVDPPKVVLKLGEVLVSDFNSANEEVAMGTAIAKIRPATLPQVMPKEAYYLCVAFAKTEEQVNAKLADYWSRGIKAYKIYYPKNKYYYVYVDKFKDNYTAEKAKWSGNYNVSNIWSKYIPASE